MARIADTDLILNADGSVYHLNLLPKHVGDTVLAVGDPSRVYMVSEHFDEVEFEMNKREFITHVGNTEASVSRLSVPVLAPIKWRIFSMKLMPW